MPSRLAAFRSKRFVRAVSGALPILAGCNVCSGHATSFYSPRSEEKFHNCHETEKFLKDLAQKYAHLARVISIGKSVGDKDGKRDIWALQINSSGQNLKDGKSGKPGIVFMGNHHAREHLSNEIPLMLAEYLLKNRQTASIQQLLSTRDIWIIPMDNPDGVEFDIRRGRHEFWRKNRRDNGDGNWGVDLNRNYSFGWRKGTNGASDETDSDVYRGPAPFSEPETQAVRHLWNTHSFVTVLNAHTYGNLLSYPWV